MIFSIFSNRSYKWSGVRAEHLKKQPYCQACGRKDDLQVHHIVPVHIDKSKELDDTNLITLCSKNCHLSIGHLMDFKSWNNNVVEDAKVYYSKVINRPYNLEIQSNEKNNIFDHCRTVLNNILCWNNRSRNR